MRKDISGDLIPLVFVTPENSVSTSSENGSNTTSSEHTEPQAGPSGPEQSTDNSNESEEVKVRTKRSKAKERLKSKDVPERQRVGAFPRHDEDLKHFKRVQISDSDTPESPSQLSVLAQLHEGFTQFKHELVNVRSERPSRLSDKNQ